MYSYMGHLGSALFFSGDPSRCYLVAYTNYYDASGQETQPHLKALVVVGAVATTLKWAAFEKHWSKVLRLYEVPAFHATDFENSEGVFKDWPLDDPRREPFLAALVKAYNKGVNKTFIIGLILTDYRKVTDKYTLAKGTDGAYAVATLGCIGVVEDWLKKKKPAPKKWEHIVEKGDPGQRVFEELAAKIELNATVIYKRDPQTKELRLPFQTSDLIAFYHRRYYAKIVATGVRHHMDQTLARLRRMIPCSVGMKDYDALERTCIAMEIPLR